MHFSLPRLGRRHWLRLGLVIGLAALALSSGCGAAAAPPEEEPAGEEAPAEEEEAPAEAEATEAAAAATGFAAAEQVVEVAFEGETTVRGGEAVTSGVLAVEDLGVGTVDASAPEEMMVGESGSVRVEIEPLRDPDEVEVEAYVTVTAVEDPVEVLNYYDELRLYSIMSARLSAPGFDVDSATPATQRLTEGVPALWVWNVIPREAGRRSVTVSVSVPILVDGQVQDVVTSPLRTIEFVIEVVGPPTPTPTATLVPTQAPTPMPTPSVTPTPTFFQRTTDEFAPEVIAGIILGLLGTAGSFAWSRVRRGRRAGGRPGRRP